jgi:hypothetical protein
MRPVLLKKPFIRLELQRRFFYDMPSAMNQDRPIPPSDPPTGNEDAEREAGSVPTRPQNRSVEETAELNFGTEPEMAPFAPIVIKPKPAEPAANKPEFKTTGSPSIQSTVKPSPEAASKSFLRPSGPATGKTYFTRGEPDRSSASRPARPSAEAPVQQPTTTPKSMPLQTPTVSEFRKNVERQSREQKAVGDVLSWVGYSLLGGLIIVALMAGFGGYTLYRMIQDQSVTVAQFDAKYGAETASLHENVKDLEQELTQSRSLAARQQDQITRLSSRLDEANATLKTQKQIIDRDMADLKGRVRRMEGVRP